MAANCVIESNDRVIGERKNVEVVDCRKATDLLIGGALISEPNGRTHGSCRM